MIKTKPIEKRVVIKVGNDKISGVLHEPENIKGSVVLSHGLLSSKESQKYKLLGKVFSSEGFATLRFDFRGCGESDRTLLDTSLTTRVEDLTACIDFMRKLSEDIYLMGSSLGGVVSIICAKREKVKALSLWATPFRFRNVKKRSETLGIPPLSEDFYKELDDYDPMLFLPYIKDCLIIHGTRDEIVPLEHAWLIYENVRKPKKLFIVEGADHVFSMEEHLRRALMENVKWFQGVRHGE